MSTPPESSILPAYYNTTLERYIQELKNAIAANIQKNKTMRLSGNNVTAEQTQRIFPAIEIAKLLTEFERRLHSLHAIAALYRALFQITEEHLKKLVDSFAKPEEPSDLVITIPPRIIKDITLSYIFKLNSMLSNSRNTEYIRSDKKGRNSLKANGQIEIPHEAKEAVAHQVDLQLYIDPPLIQANQQWIGFVQIIINECATEQLEEEKMDSQVEIFAKPKVFVTAEQNFMMGELFNVIYLYQRDIVEKIRMYEPYKKQLEISQRMIIDIVKNVLIILDNFAQCCKLFELLNNLKLHVFFHLRDPKEWSFYKHYKTTKTWSMMLHMIKTRAMFFLLNDPTLSAENIKAKLNDINHDLLGAKRKNYDGKADSRKDLDDLLELINDQQKFAVKKEKLKTKYNKEADELGLTELVKPVAQLTN